MAEQAIQIKGLDRLRKAFKRFPSLVAQHMTKAGAEAANEILDTRGLRNYPGAGSGNRPPTPYYIRGVGTQYKSFNAANSERYGSKWTVRSASYRTTIGNIASYAPYLAGEKQANAMAKIGWIKLTDGAKKKMTQIVRIYQLYVDRALKRAGL